MTETQMLAYLTLRLQPNVEPLLLPDELAALVVIGMGPGGIREALYVGWDTKAAKALADFDITSGENALNQSQVYKHCVYQRDNYAIDLQGGVTVTGPTGGKGLKSVRTYRGL